MRIERYHGYCHCSTLALQNSLLPLASLFHICVIPRRTRLDSSDGFGMHLTLLESDRSFFQVAECAFVSVLAHAGLVYLVINGALSLAGHRAERRMARA